MHDARLHYITSAYPTTLQHLESNSYHSSRTSPTGVSGRRCYNYHIYKILLKSDKMKKENDERARPQGEGLLSEY